MNISLQNYRRTAKHTARDWVLGTLKMWEACIYMVSLYKYEYITLVIIEKVIECGKTKWGLIVSWGCSSLRHLQNMAEELTAGDLISKLLSNDTWLNTRVNAKWHKKLVVQGSLCVFQFLFFFFSFFNRLRLSSSFSIKTDEKTQKEWQAGERQWKKEGGWRGGWGSPFWGTWLRQSLSTCHRYWARRLVSS